MSNLHHRRRSSRAQSVQAELHRLAELRARLEAHIEAMLTFLDELDGDPDLVPEPDDEPSLCGVTVGWPSGGAEIGNVDLEGPEDDLELDSDAEPDIEEAWAVPVSLNPDGGGPRIVDVPSPPAVAPSSIMLTGPDGHRYIGAAVR